MVYYSPHWSSGPLVLLVVVVVGDVVVVEVVAQDLCTPEHEEVGSTQNDPGELQLSFFQEVSGSDEKLLCHLHHLSSHSQHRDTLLAEIPLCSTQLVHLHLPLPATGQGKKNTK